MEIRLVPSRPLRTSRPCISRRCLPLDLSPTLHEPPIDERIVYERFEDGHDRFLVLAQYSHRVLRSNLESPFDSGHLSENALVHEGEGEGDRDVPPWRT